MPFLLQRFQQRLDPRWLQIYDSYNAKIELICIDFIAAFSNNEQ